MYRGVKREGAVERLKEGLNELKKTLERVEGSSSAKLAWTLMVGRRLIIYIPEMGGRHCAAHGVGVEESVCHQATWVVPLTSCC